MTLKDFYELTKDLPDTTEIQYHDSQGIDCDVKSWATEVRSNGYSRIVLDKPEFY